jgi:glycosyltransferase involved in cell wall biosynthesis
VARYACETLLALDRLVGEGHPLTRDLVLDVVAPCARADIALAHIPVRIVPEYRLRLPQVWCQAQLPTHVPGGLISFCNLAPVAVRRHIVCIHDLHTRLMPADYGFGFRLAHRIVLPLLGRRAAAITTVSELSRGDLVRFGIAPAAKIHVTYNGADHARAWTPAADTFVRTRERPYVLGFGRPQPYKNTALFWRIAAALDAMDLDIVLVGALTPEIAAGYGPLPRNLQLMGKVSDGGLAQAMRGAVCLAFPSRIEGFGLPAVEAMIQGCPVVASTIPALREVCAEAALYADPERPSDWVRAIARLAQDAAFRDDLVARGRAQSERFSWRRIAETYLGLMAEIDGADAGAA